MTLESFARRLGAASALSGLALWVAAVVCWASVGDGGSVVHSIHMVAGWSLAVFGAVLIGIGLAISSGVPARTRPEDPSIKIDGEVS